MLRVLWSRIGKPRIGPPTAFSFNVPMRKASGAMNVDKGKGQRIVVRDIVYFGGMCPRCEGIGPRPEDPEVDPVQGRGRDAAAHPRFRGTRGHVHYLSRMWWHAPQ